MNAQQRLKANARAHANTAVRRGTLKRKPCEVCGDADSVKHHDDYSKPLEVRWLCRKCHKAHHAAHGHDELLRGVIPAWIKPTKKLERMAVELKVTAKATEPIALLRHNLAAQAFIRELHRVNYMQPVRFITERLMRAAKSAETPP
jgi:ribosomal protein S27AE